jgi:hypothetical protein
MPHEKLMFFVQEFSRRSKGINTKEKPSYTFEAFELKKFYLIPACPGSQ